MGTGTARALRGRRLGATGLGEAGVEIGEAGADGGEVGDGDAHL